MLLEL